MGYTEGKNSFSYLFYYCKLGEEKADYTIPENCPERADPFFEIELKRFEMI